MAHFNQLEPPEEALRPGPRHRPGRPIPAASERAACGPWCCGWCGWCGDEGTAELGRACAGRRAAALGEREAGRPEGWVEARPGREKEEAAEAGPPAAQTV